MVVVGEIQQAAIHRGIVQCRAHRWDDGALFREVEALHVSLLFLSKAARGTGAVTRE